jgi:hypothetical protein
MSIVGYVARKNWGARARLFQYRNFRREWEFQADRGLVAEALELNFQGVFMGLNWLQCLKEPLRLLSSSQAR